MNIQKHKEKLLSYMDNTTKDKGTLWEYIHVRWK